MSDEPITNPPVDKPKARLRISWPIVLLLIAALAVGVYFRFVGLDWDEEQHLHPDERFLTMVTERIRPPENIAAYFDSQTSTLNPYNNDFGLYVYGDLPIFLTRYFAGFLDSVCATQPLPEGMTWPEDQAQPCFNSQSQAFQYRDYSHIYLVGRSLSALLDVFALVFLFVIGKRLYNAKVGLLAVALGAGAVLQIQQAHFYTADAISMFFVVACFFFIVRLQDTFSWGDAIAAGFSAGLAVASRINVAPVLGILAVAVFIPVFSRWRDPQRKATLEGAIGRLVIALIIALIAFRIFMPYAFDGLLHFDPRWSSNMDYARRLNSGEDPGGPPGVQWTNRPAIVFPWINIVFWGLGVPLGIAAWLSWAWAAWQIFLTPYFRNRHGKIMDWLSGVAQSRHLLIWLWVTGYFFWMGSSWVKSIRYQLPIYPFLTLLAAAGLMALFEWAKHRVTRATLWRAMAVVAVVVVLLGTYAWAFAFTEIYRQPTTRVAASRWIYENVPTAVTLTVQEAGTDRSLPLPIPSSLLLPGNGVPQGIPFQVDHDSVLQSVTLPHVLDPLADDEPETLRVTVASDPDGLEALAQADTTVQAESFGAHGGSVTFELDPIALQPDRDYYAILTAVDGAPIQAEGSTLANEHWDDPIPLRVDGRDGFSNYRGITLNNYDPDSPEKLAQMIDWLDTTDYIMLTSNRLYGSIPRMPHQYPMTSEFYRLLFEGQLGYRLKAVFESYPRLGPFVFPDQETTQALGIWPDPTRCPQAEVSTCAPLVNVPMPPAEEAFSVYDHPRVLIFEKMPDFDARQALNRLSRIDLQDVQRDVTPMSETQAPTGLMLPAATWQAQQETGTWSEMFDRNGLFNQAPLIGGIAWYAAIFLIGLFAFPIVYAAAPGLRDRGYGIARMAGLLVAVFVIWFLASYQIVPFTRTTIFLSFLALGLMGGIAAWRQRVSLRAFVREHRRTLLIEEVLFGAAFLLFLLVRFGNPDLWHPVMGGEKPMDFAYLNAVIKSQYFPPYDPWHAGGQITYYYFGFVLVAALIKLLGIMPALAYNFAIPTLFALTALGAFCVAFNLVQAFGRWVRDRSYWLKDPSVIGVIAAVFVVFMGSLGGVQVVQEQVSKYGGETFPSTITPLKQLVDTAQGAAKMVADKTRLTDLMRPEWWYFTPTREIPAPPTEAGPISEFPYFTFLYADLHAHMIAMPITLLVLALAVSWLTRPPLGTWGGIVSIGLGGLAAGALRPTNTWDYPTYLVIGAVALFFGTWAAERLDRISAWMHLILRLAGFVLIGFVAFMPFTRSYATAYSSIEEWKGSLTPLWAYLNIHLLFLFPIVTFIVWEIKRWGWRWWRAVWRTVLKHWHWVVIVAGFIAAAALLVLYFANREVATNEGLSVTLQRDVVLIAMPIMLICAVLALRPRLAAAQRFWYFVVFLAVALTLVVEIVVLKGDISRMNTTFKFYLQVWILLGISAAVALGWLADRLQHWSGWSARLWKGFMGVLVVASFFYVVTATPNKISDRWATPRGPGLNGADYMLTAEYDIPPFPLKWDYEAIQWLQDNVQGTPVIAEAGSGLANVPLYQWGSRISINTGLPTIIGWDWHQRQQRSIMPGWVIDRRLQDVYTLYETPDEQTARTILDQYNVKYVILGALERQHYPPEGLPKFDQMVADGSLRVAYQNDGTTIYEVVRGSGEQGAVNQ